MFARLNSLGETVGKPTPKPTSRIGRQNQKQVGVLYGHNGGGKVYNYLGGQGLRAGDVVTPEVTHPKSGKTYKTLARVVSTRDATGTAAGETAGYLSGQGILMKTIGPTDQRSLPGYQARAAQTPGFTAKQWQAEADDKYKQTIMCRLNPLGEVRQGGNQQ